jgi:neutral ceramidase
MEQAMTNTNSLLASVVQVDITPPVGVWLEGFMERQEPSLGVHDPLLAQVLMVRRGEAEGVVLVSLDLIGVRLDFTDRVREGISSATGIAKENILLACSHTHSGPTGFLTGLPVIHTPADPELVQVVERKLIGAAVEASRTLRPARLGVGHGRLRGLGTSRLDPKSEVLDDEVTVLRIDEDARQPMAVWMNFGCHPTVMGHENLWITADYPGAARATLRRIYPDTIFLYANGASGDVSTRFTRREQSFAEVERMGRLLAGEVLKVTESLVCVTGGSLCGRIEPLDLSFRSFPADEEVQREIKHSQSELARLQQSGASHGEIRRAMTRAEGAVAREWLIRELNGMDRMHTQLQILEVGALSLVGLPGEPFTRIVLDIKARSGRPHTAVVSYCGDEAGYFPDRQAFAEGTYEALITPYRDDVGDLLTDRAVRLLHGA